MESHAVSARSKGVGSLSSDQPPIYFSRAYRVVIDRASNPSTSSPFMGIVPKILEVIMAGSMSARTSAFWVASWLLFSSGTAALRSRIPETNNALFVRSDNRIGTRGKNGFGKCIRKAHDWISQEHVATRMLLKRCRG